MPGVRIILSADSLKPGSQSSSSEPWSHTGLVFNNKSGHVKEDEVLFAEGEVHAVGQLMALVVADTEHQVRLACFCTFPLYSGMVGFHSLCVCRRVRQPRRSS